MSTFEWPPKGTGGGGAGITIYPNFAAFPPSAPNGTVAKDGGAHIVYEYNSTTVMWEPVASNAAYEAALLVIAGTPYTFAGFDTTGSLETIPGWAFDPVTKGLSQTNVTDPAAGNFVLNNLQGNVSPSASTANAYIGANFVTQYDLPNAGFDLDRLDSFIIDEQHIGDGTISLMRSLATIQRVGDGVSAGFVTQLESVNFASGIQPGSTVTNGSGINFNFNNQGTLSNDYSLMNLNIGGNAVGRNLQGLVVNVNAPITGDVSLFNAGNSQPVGGRYSGIVVGNSNGSTISSDFTHISSFNGGDVGGNFQSIGMSNNGDVTGNVSGLSFFNTGTIGGNLNLMTLGTNNSGTDTVTGSIFGINCYNNVPSGQDYVGMFISNNANVGGRMQGVNIGLQGTSTLGVTGLSISLDNAVGPVGQQKSGLSVSDGTSFFQSNVNTSTFSPSGEWQHNLLSGLFHIEAGFPVSGAFGFGNNIGINIVAEDDMAADNTLGASSLGFSANGLVGQAAVFTGKTVDTFNLMAAGAGIPPQSTGGSFTNVTMFRALGLLPSGGTVNVTNMYGFKAEPILSAVSPTNVWGVWVGDTNADNWFAKDVVIGGSTGKPEAGQALDVTGAVRFRNLTTAGVVTTDASGHLSSSPVGTGVATYATFAAFPPSAGDGSLAVALDTDFLYVFNAGTMTWLPIAQPGAVVPILEEITVTPTDITNGFVTLAHTPNDVTDVLLAPADGPVQVYLVDYNVSGASLIWTGFALDGVIVAGDILTVSYFWFDPTAVGGLGGASILGLTQTSDEYTLTPTDITNAFVTLSNTPNTPNAVILTIRGSIGQAYGLDYTVAGNVFSWSGLGLDGQLVSGDVISVNYFHT